LIALIWFAGFLICLTVIIARYRVLYYMGEGDKGIGEYLAEFGVAYSSLWFLCIPIHLVMKLILAISWKVATKYEHVFMPVDLKKRISHE
jgi:hypothetical protein